MKKLTAMLLALVMLFALAACGGGSDKPSTSTNPGTSDQPSASQNVNPQPGSDTSSLAGKKVGLMIYSTTTPWAINIIDTVTEFCKQFGMEVAVAEAGNPGEVVSAAENLLAAGIDGMLCAMDGGIANKVMELCAAKQIYTTFTFTDLLGADFYDEIAANEYYAGSINSMDYEAGYAMTQHCIDLGADKWVFLGMPEGTSDSIDARAKGFKDCLAANGLELLSEARTYDKVEGAQNLITNFPELNGFGSGLNAAKNASGALETAGKMGSVYMFCYEAAESYVKEYFDAGALHGCADGVVGHVELALAQLCCAMDGHKITGSDGKAVGYHIPYLIAYNSDDFSVLIDNSYNGNYIFNLDEMKSLISVYNPDVTADDYQKQVDNYTIESLQARRG